MIDSEALFGFVLVGGIVAILLFSWIFPAEEGMTKEEENRRMQPLLKVWAVCIGISLIIMFFSKGCAFRPHMPPL